MRSTVALGVVIGFLALVPAAGASHACGNVLSKPRGGVFIGKIRASGISCRESRWLIRRFHNLSRPSYSTFRKITNGGGRVIGVEWRYNGHPWRVLDYRFQRRAYEAGLNVLNGGGVGNVRITWRTSA